MKEKTPLETTMSIVRTNGRRRFKTNPAKIGKKEKRNLRLQDTCGVECMVACVNFNSDYTTIHTFSYKSCNIKIHSICFTCDPWHNTYLFH